MRRVAIIGGGGVGACTALELAQNGCQVTIFEQRAEAVLQASRVNEGKIHQGFIYAKDRSLDTVRLMTAGALTFRQFLARWIDTDQAVRFSRPFVYGVHKDSMLSVDELGAHFQACCDIFADAQSVSRLDYLGQDSRINFTRLSKNELADVLNPESFDAAFQTSELGVETRRIADHIRLALPREDRIELRTRCTVTSAARRNDGKFTISFEADGHRDTDGPFDAVINAAWENRLKIDQTVGIRPAHDWSYRHKFGSRVNIDITGTDLPSVTSVLGPLGDIVNYGEDGLFVSWYPTGMVSMISELAPPADWLDMTREDRMRVFRASIKHWAGLSPAVADFVYDDDQVDPLSGVIFAWGDTDIDDRQSGLHARSTVGIHSEDGYHTVNTGKYTLVPYYAMQAADRILGREPSGSLMP
jgi:hypothetical protein